MSSSTRLEGIIKILVNSSFFAIGFDHKYPCKIFLMGELSNVILFKVNLQKLH